MSCATQYPIFQSDVEHICRRYTGRLTKHHTIILYIHTYQSQHSAKSDASSSNHFLSSSSNPAGSVQSTSMIATVYRASATQRNTASTKESKLTSPPTRIGTTISLRLLASQAICPGKLNTSGTITVSRFSAAVPHTPRPKRISWQAGRPWNGPSSRRLLVLLLRVFWEPSAGNLSWRM